MKFVKLSEVCTLKTGKTPPTKYEKYFNGNINWYNPSDLDKSKILTSSKRKISSIAFDDKKAVIFNRGTLLMTCIGEIGKIGITNDICSSNQQITALIPSEKIDVNYLYYTIKKLKPFLNDTANNAVVPILNNRNLSTIKIPLPSLSEQKRIAGILDEADKLRQLNQQLISKYNQLTQSLFLDMFGDPVTNPKGWEVKTIENLIKKEKYSLKRGPFGGALKKEVFVETGFLVYEQFHALNNDFSFERYFINKEKFDELKAFEVKPKDIIISCSGVYLGKLAIIPDNAKKGIINQALLKVSLDETVMTNNFFTFHFTQKNFKNTYFNSNRGAGIPNFPPMKEFKKFPFIHPPIKLQNEFEKRIQIIEQQKAQAQEALQKSEDLFNSLLQKAFKGEV